MWCLIPFTLLLPFTSAFPQPGSLTEVKEGVFATPGTPNFHIYVPRRITVPATVVVAIHSCQSSAQKYFRESPWKNNADSHGFLTIYPSSPREGGCWDISSNKTLTHNGGSDSKAIVEMVKWTLQNYPEVDSANVKMVGVSSGGMMVNVLAAAYPEKFSAGIVYSGVAAGCFKSPSNEVAAWNNECALGRVKKSIAEWASIAKGMRPGYDGPRPRMLIYHGGRDSTINIANYDEEIKQWSGIFGIDPNRPVEKHDDVRDGMRVTVSRYSPKLIGILVRTGSHQLAYAPDVDMQVFGLKAMGNPPKGGQAPRTAAPPKPKGTSNAPPVSLSTSPPESLPTESVAPTSSTSIDPTLSSSVDSTLSSSADPTLSASVGSTSQSPITTPSSTDVIVEESTSSTTYTPITWVDETTPVALPTTTSISSTWPAASSSTTTSTSWVLPAASSTAISTSSALPAASSTLSTSSLSSISAASTALSSPTEFVSETSRSTSYTPITWTEDATTASSVATESSSTASSIPSPSSVGIGNPKGSLRTGRPTTSAFGTGSPTPSTLRTTTIYPSPVTVTVQPTYSTTAVDPNITRKTTSSSKKSSSSRPIIYVTQTASAVTVTVTSAQGS